MAQIYPLDIIRRLERRWQRRFHIATPCAARNDSRAAGGLYPMRKGNAPISDVSDENVSPPRNASS